MSSLHSVRAQIDTGDLVIMVVVENYAEGRDSVATPLAIAGAISGAPVRGVADKLERLARLGALKLDADGYHVTELGVAVMELDVDGFQPGQRETQRRDQELSRALNGFRA